MQSSFLLNFYFFTGLFSDQFKDITCSVLIVFLFLCFGVIGLVCIPLMSVGRVCNWCHSNDMSLNHNCGNNSRCVKPFHDQVIDDCEAVLKEAEDVIGLCRTGPLYARFIRNSGFLSKLRPTRFGRVNGNNDQRTLQVISKNEEMCGRVESISDQYPRCNYADCTISTHSRIDMDQKVKDAFNKLKEAQIEMAKSCLSGSNHTNI